MIDGTLGLYKHMCVANLWRLRSDLHRILLSVPRDQVWLPWEQPHATHPSLPGS